MGLARRRARRDARLSCWASGRRAVKYRDWTGVNLVAQNAQSPSSNLQMEQCAPIRMRRSKHGVNARRPIMASEDGHLKHQPSVVNHRSFIPPQYLREILCLREAPHRRSFTCRCVVRASLPDRRGAFVSLFLLAFAVNVWVSRSLCLSRPRSLPPTLQATGFPRSPATVGNAQSGDRHAILIMVVPRFHVCVVDPGTRSL